MFSELRVSHIVAGFIAILVGYTGSVAIIFQVAEVVAATPDQMNSWFLVLRLGLGLTSIGLSWFYKMPILTAWSTPGAAFLISALAGFDMAQAIGAFILSGMLIFLTGVTGLFERINKLIPPALASALLAGVLLQFCLDAFVQLQTEPVLVGGMFLVFAVSLKFLPRYAVPLALLTGVILSLSTGLIRTNDIQLSFAQPVWTTPVFSISAVVGISIPLYFITMAGQNVPGMAILRSSGYDVSASPLISWTGVVTVFTAPFGGFALNLAAITAAICAGEEAGENPDHRYLASIFGGIFYLIAALFGATIVMLLSISPKALVLAIAGIALIGTFSNSMANAYLHEEDRLSVSITFLVSASGIQILGVSSAFWALLVGGIVRMVFNRNRP
ncbi:MAG: benzoate/H(+) symporter BenE family transporter [Gammaproteobacteria bacterium]|nr:benzoate/H(+) symporter BenE family transporter [Gammaproteobacteria bacterium]